MRNTFKTVKLQQRNTNSIRYPKRGEESNLQKQPGEKTTKLRQSSAVSVIF